MSKNIIVPSQTSSSYTFLGGSWDRIICVTVVFWTPAQNPKDFISRVLYTADFLYFPLPIPFYHPNLWYLNLSSSVTTTSKTQL